MEVYAARKGMAGEPDQRNVALGDASQEQREEAVQAGLGEPQKVLELFPELLHSDFGGWRPWGFLFIPKDLRPRPPSRKRLVRIS